MTAAQPQPMLPCVEPNTAGVAVLGESAAPFAYIGRACTQAEFTEYVASYNFGAVPPDSVVIHHTANPDASWAARSKSSATWWDRDEDGMDALTIRNKRNKQLDGIAAYYRSLGWPSGPHLFIDDRFIWLFTPMYEVGTHAKEGNSYYDAAGRLHYSLGIEVVGYYEKLVWPPAVQANVRHAIKTVQARLKTFDLVYRAGPPHRPDLHRGSIALHRDYNKPACPGAAISGDFVISVLTAKSSPPPPKVTTAFRLRGPTVVFESPSPTGNIALNGRAQLREGEVIEVDEVRSDGWAHLASALGFVPAGVLGAV